MLSNLSNISSLETTSNRKITTRKDKRWMAQLMNQICTPHLAYHYKILPHSVVIGIAVVLLILLLMSGWSALSYQKWNPS